MGASSSTSYSQMEEPRLPSEPCRGPPPLRFPSPPRATPAGAVPATLMKPPPEPILLPVLRSYPVIADCILKYLSTKEHLTLMRCSKESKEIITEFLRHSNTCNGRGEQVLSFLQDESIPKMLWELSLLQKITKHSDPMSSSILHTACDLYKPRPPRRICVKNSYDFPHLGNSNYIVVEQNERLNRNIVRLKTVCWLQFKILFRHMPKGHYQASLRMGFVQSRFGWPDEDNSYTTIKVSKGDEVLCESHVVPKIWSSYLEGKPPTMSPVGATITRDFNHSNWIWLRLTPFTLSEAADELVFEFVDIENRWWKHGMLWDFVELKPLEQSND